MRRAAYKFDGMGLIGIVIVIVLLILMLSLIGFLTPPCSKTSAGAVVDCIATRTAEAGDR